MERMIATSSSTPVSPLMTPDELASWLHCTRRAVYDRVYRGQLPGPMRVGRRLYFLRDRVLTWLREATDPSPRRPP